MDLDDNDSPRNNQPVCLKRERTFEVVSSSNQPWANQHNNNKPIGLHRLRYQLASEGCSESQTSLAKSLLQEESNNVKDKKENEELAVRWLVMAASEGNPEALEFLQNCYQNSIGITDSNRARVEKCLNSSPEERIAQLVGQSIFRLMSFDVKEPIPLPYFKLKINSFLSGKEVSSEELESTDKDCSPSSKVSVDQVISSINQSLNGQEPDVFIESAIPLKKKIENKALDFLACKGILLLIYVENLLRYLSDVLVIHTVLIIGVMAALFLVLLPTLLVDQAQNVIVKATNSWITCASYVIMIFSSAKIINLHQVEINVRKWIKVVKKFDIKPKVTKTSHFSMDLKLFTAQIVGAVVYLVYTEDAFDWIISRHLLFLSLLFLLATKPDRIMKILYGVHFLVAFVKFHVLPYSCPHWKELFIYQLKFSGYTLSISPIALFGIILISIHSYVFVKMYKKTYFLNLSGILWINIFVGALSSISFGSLTSDLTFWALFLLGSNRMAHATSYGIGIIAESALSYTMLGSATGFGTFALLFAATKVSKFLQDKLGNSKLIMFCLVTLVASMLYLTANNRRIVSTQPNKEISWDNYSLRCHKPAWSENNMATTQIYCDRYEGYKITISGTVDSVKRTSKENSLETIIYSFTSTMQRWLLFIFEEDIIAVAIGKLSACCLKNFITNQFEIKVQIIGTFRVEAELGFQVNDRCENFALSLRNNDNVRMTGTLVRGIGTEKPILNFLHGKCTSCVEKVSCNTAKSKVPTDEPTSNLNSSVIITNISTFFLEPFAFLTIGSDEVVK